MTLSSNFMCIIPLRPYIYNMCIMKFICWSLKKVTTENGQTDKQKDGQLKQYLSPPSAKNISEYPVAYPAGVRWNPPLRPLFLNIQ